MWRVDGTATFPASTQGGTRRLKLLLNPTGTHPPSRSHPEHARYTVAHRGETKAEELVSGKESNGSLCCYKVNTLATQMAFAFYDSADCHLFCYTNSRVSIQKSEEGKSLNAHIYSQ